MYFKTTYLNSDFINILKAKGYTSDTINLEKLKSQCTHLGMTGNIKSYWRMVKEVKGIKVGLSCIQDCRSQAPALGAGPTARRSRLLAMSLLRRPDRAR